MAKYIIQCPSPGGGLHLIELEADTIRTEGNWVFFYGIYQTVLAQFSVFNIISVMRDDEKKESPDDTPSW